MATALRCGSTMLKWLVPWSSSWRHLQPHDNVLSIWSINFLKEQLVQYWPSNQNIIAAFSMTDSWETWCKEVVTNKSESCTCFRSIPAGKWYYQQFDSEVFQRNLGSAYLPLPSSHRRNPGRPSSFALHTCAWKFQWVGAIPPALSTLQYTRIWLWCLRSAQEQ